jgi:tetratricopeptide (TPR) repeat protein
MGIDRRFLSIIFLLTSVALTRAQVRVWQGTLTLPTYEEGLPDPNPPFDQLATNQFNYPYTLRDNLTNRRVNHAWRAIYLENEYLKCSVLPDIGGHVYTCMDKLSGQTMFYANPSIKKADIGYRGAWAAFGIEFNFPISHNWVSMSPVDFAFSMHTDGSASVTVGNIDRVYGMEWSVEVILRPKSTLVEERVTLNNRSDVRHRFYWWNNAAVEVWDDSRIEYPMRFAASHGFTEVQPWPVGQDGTDLSIIHNHTKGPVSLFVHGSREPFMGIWNPKTSTGTAHFAYYSELPAKKIWSWGVDADGLDWRKALSDNDSAYVEVQAGLFRNQETYAFLEPRQTIRFSEYWMPVREIGGISLANLAGIVSLSRRLNTLLVGFNANQLIPNASVLILDGNQRLLEEKTNLSPKYAWRREVNLPNVQAKCTFELRDASGAVLLRQTEGEYDWTPEKGITVGPQPSYHTPASANRTEDDWLQFGENQELNGKTLLALATYQEALQKFPGGFALQKAAGRLATSLLRFDEAIGYLETVHRRDTTDAEAAYYLGLAYDGVGQTRSAQSAYENAYRMPQFRAAAGLHLGEMSARDGDLRSAETYLRESLQSAPNELRVGEELIAVRDALGETSETRVLAEKWLTQFPLSYFLRDELAIPDLDHLADDADRVLNIASEYMRLGLYRRALLVLSRKYPSAKPDETEPGALPPPEHPLVAYFRGYCKEKLGKSSSADYDNGSRLSTSFVFPNTVEEVTVLRAVLRVNPSDSTAHYLLGTFYFSRGLTDHALAEWSQAERLNAKLPVLDASMGTALLYGKHDPHQALGALRRGLHGDPANVGIYVGLDQALSILGSSAGDRVHALETFPDQANMPSDLIYELILNLAEAGNYDRATALFRNRFFPRQEGGTNVRQVWIEVQLQHILALAQAGNCMEALQREQQVGSADPGLLFTQDGLKPIIDSARTNYLLGMAESKCGKSEESKSRFRSSESATGADQIVWSWSAARQLPGFDQSQWQPRLEAALTEAETLSETSSFASKWVYTAGTLDAALGHPLEAQAKFQKALLLPDRMLAYHLARIALAETKPR